MEVVIGLVIGFAIGASGVGGGTLMVPGPYFPARIPGADRCRNRSSFFNLCEDTRVGRIFLAQKN